MRNLKYVVFLCSFVSIVFAVVARIFLPGKVLFGLASITYLRLTITLLLFAITFHLLLGEK